MQFFGVTIEWYEPGMRPNYRRDSLVRVIHTIPFTGSNRRWFAVWIGDRIRIGRSK